ncbi:adhesion regulating molecule 1 [Gonapodya sp. JEL0774]|nr:adhesion regulating molecule 1 [Gonapodya sp. JEL0774]
MATALPANIFGGSLPKSTNIVEFKAGKLYRDGSMLKPDPRRGLVYLYKSDDGLLHFVWKDRKTNAVEDDLIVFPMEANFVPVTQSKGRVFMLKFESSSAKHFFWMQEPSADKDTSFVTKVNEAISGEAADESATASPTSDDVPMETAPSPAAPAAPMTTPSTTAPATSSAAAAAPSGATQDQLNQIRDIIAGMTVPPGAEDVDLSEVFTAEKLTPVIENPVALAALFPHLPEGAPRTKAEVSEVVRSPQFKQQLRRLQAAIRSGQLGPFLQTIGLDPNVATVRDFLKGIQGKMDQSKMDES